MQIQWSKKQQDMRSLLRLFELDFGLGLVACQHDGSFASRIVVRWCAVWGLIAYMLCIFGLGKGMARVKGRNADFIQLTKMGGTTYLFLSVSISRVAYLFFTCFRNPTGQLTLDAFRDVDCGSDEYGKMFPLGVFHAFAFVVVPIGWVAATVWMLPARTLEDPEIAHRYTFLFDGYRLARFYWVLCQIVVISLFTAVPAMAQKDGLVQAMVSMSISFAYCAVATSSKPFSVKMGNQIEVLVHGATLLQVLVAACCGFVDSPHTTVIFERGEREAREGGIAWVVSAGMGCIVLMVLGGVLNVVRCRTGQKRNKLKTELKKVAEACLEPGQLEEIVDRLAPTERDMINQALAEVLVLIDCGRPSAELLWACGSRDSCPPREEAGPRESLGGLGPRRSFEDLLPTSQFRVWEHAVGHNYDV